MKQQSAIAAAACLIAATSVLAAQTPPDQKPATPPSAGQSQGKTPSGTAGTAGKSTQAGEHGAMAKGADASFVREAAVGGMAEVELGRLATQNASSDDVKQFGQRMVEDHGKANDELKALASQKHMTLPTGLDQKHQALRDRLAKLNGAAFDKAYMSEMVSDHQKDVAAFQREARSGTDADIKAWAQKTVPTLQEHLKLAKQVSSQVSGRVGTTGKGHAPGATKEETPQKKAPGKF
jgi:putative membrane protein